MVGFSTNVIGNVIMLIMTLLITHNLSLEEYGKFRLLFSFCSFAVLVLMLGRDSCMLYIANNNEKENRTQKIQVELYNGLISLAIGFLLLLVLYDYVINYILNDNVSVVEYFVAIMMIPLWGIYNLLTPILRINGEQNRVFYWNNLLQRVLRLFCVFVFLFVFSDDVNTVSFGMILSQAILLIYAISYTSKFYIKSFKYNLTDFPYNCKLSISLCINAIFLTLISTINIFFVNTFSGVEAVALIDINILLLTLMLFPYVAFCKSSEPFISRVILEDKVEVDNFVKNRRISTFLVTSCGVFLFLFGNYILVLFGDDFTEAYLPLRVGIVFFIMSSYFGPVSETINMTGNPRVNTGILCLSTLLSLFIFLVFRLYFDVLLVSMISMSFSLLFYRSICFIYCYKKCPSLVMYMKETNEKFVLVFLFFLFLSFVNAYLNVFISIFIFVFFVLLYSFLFEYHLYKKVSFLFSNIK